MNIQPPEKDCTIQEFKQWVVDVVDARRKELKAQSDFLAWLKDPFGEMHYLLGDNAFELSPAGRDVFDRYVDSLGIVYNNFPLDNSLHNV